MHLELLYYSNGKDGTQIFCNRFFTAGLGFGGDFFFFRKKINRYD